MSSDIQCNMSGPECYRTIKDMEQHIASLSSELDSYKNKPDCSTSKRSQTRQPSTGVAPVCLCGVSNLQEENMRLRQGLMAKHNEVVHLRGLMANPDNFAKQSLCCNQNAKSTTMYMDQRLPAGGSPSLMNGGYGGSRRFSDAGCMHNKSTGTMCHANSSLLQQYGSAMQTSSYVVGGPPCVVAGCPHGPRDCMTACRGSGIPSGVCFQNSMPLCNPTQSATTIIVASKRQMEETEQEIKCKMQQIKGKKSELERDISRLQEVLLAKQQEASCNLQAARAARASEIAQAAHMATELQKYQRAQAMDAARAASNLQQAQDEQSRKQIMAAMAAELAQQAQQHQLIMASETAVAAERAEEAQKEQANQAEEAARAAEVVQAAQEEQNRLANKQLQDAEDLKRNQEEQACKAAQATEALHAAHVAQVAQQSQACKATSQAHTMLVQHKYIPPTMGCVQMDRPVPMNSVCRCCNPFCPKK